MPFDGKQSLFKLYGSIQKVEDNEDGTITVHGIASSESRDAAGEIVAAEAMRGALPDYSKFPALREMHQPMAAGKVLEAEVDEDGITHISALVVDPVAIVKVRTGVYAGFSIGGKVLKRDPQDRSIIIGLRLVEISLVDSPCNPDAILSMWKADQMSEFKPASADVIARAKQLAKAAGHQRFKEHLFEAGQELQCEHELAKGEIPEPIADQGGEAIAEAAAEAEPAVEPGKEAAATVEAPAGEIPAAEAENAAGEGEDDPSKEAAAQPGPDEDDHSGDGAQEPAADKEAGAEAEAIADPAAALAAEIEKGKAVIESAEPEADADADPFADLGKAAAALKAISSESPMAKSLWQVSRFAEILQSLSYVQSSLACEANSEGDGSPVPEQLREAIGNLGQILIDCAREEVAELVAELSGPDDAGPEIIYIGDDCYLAERIVDLVKADEDLMAKAGARHSKADAGHIQDAHDSTVKLGAMCDKANCDKDDDGDMAAAASADRIGELEGENESLKKALADAAPQVASLVEGFEKRLADLQKRFEDEPLPTKTAGPAITAAVTKGQDSAGAGAGEPPTPTLSPEDFKKYMAELSDAERGEIMVKMALRQPVAIGGQRAFPPAA